jgi:uncharacterized protein YecE (DUF72 family)
MAVIQKKVGLYMGSMGWSYKFWPIYSGLKPNEFLRKYANHFNSVEINSSFYRIPNRKVIENWFSQVPDNFRFSAKFPQSISHSPKLKYNEGKMDAFIRNISTLGDKLGPLLLQLPPSFHSNELKNLREFLSTLPTDLTYAVEFRNQDWFNYETYELLKENNIALVQVEHQKKPKRFELTTDFVYIRWEGNRKIVNGDKGIIEVDRKQNITEWYPKIMNYLENKMNVYGYFSKFYSGYPVNDIKIFQELHKHSH